MKKKEVEKLLKKYGKAWKEFEEFMVGQTVGGTPKNPDYYETDVDRFIRGKRVID